MACPVVKAVVVGSDGTDYGRGVLSWF